jgi:hypothetical protein
MRTEEANAGKGQSNSTDRLHLKSEKETVDEYLAEIKSVIEYQQKEIDFKEKTLQYKFLGVVPITYGLIATLLSALSVPLLNSVSKSLNETDGNKSDNTGSSSNRLRFLGEYFHQAVTATTTAPHPKSS